MFLFLSPRIPQRDPVSGVCLQSLVDCTLAPIHPLLLGFLAVPSRLHIRPIVVCSPRDWMMVLSSSRLSFLLHHDSIFPHVQSPRLYVDSRPSPGPRQAEGRQDELVRPRTSGRGGRMARTAGWSGRQGGQDDRPAAVSSMVMIVHSMVRRHVGFLVGSSVSIRAVMWH